jgi:hypothetical protein
MAELLDRVLDPGYLGDLTALPMDELRRRRAECHDVETGLSLLRRVVQGRLDIVGVELARRAHGADPASLQELIERLPEVLADRTRAAGPGRLSQLLAPASLDPDLEAELERIASRGSLAGLATRSDSELSDVAAQLEAFEARISAQRRALFERIDALQAEITRRYREGEASVESLLD